MGEIIVIQVGQCGNQLGARFWEILCAEHGLGPDGSYHGSNSQQLEHLRVFFSDHHPRYVPRAVLVDLEPEALDAIRVSDQLGELFKPDNYVFGQPGAEKNWAKGYYTEGAELLNNTMERIRKEVNNCENLQGFIVIHSLGGGTGSGMGSLIMSTLRADYPEQQLAAFSVFPSPQLSDSQVEPYNAALSIHKLIELANLVLCFDNEAAFDFCTRSLGIAAPAQADLNQVMAETLSSVTAPLRLPVNSAPPATLSDLVARLVPADAPNLHFLSVGVAPVSRSAAPGSLSEITRKLFSGGSLLTSGDPGTGKGLGTQLIFRGQVTPAEAAAQVASLQDKTSSQFVNWLAAGSKLNTTLVPLPPHGLKQAVAVVSNHTVVQKMLSRIAAQFSSLFEKREFLHWYTGEGMDESEFTAAQSALNDLIASYNRR